MRAQLRSPPPARNPGGRDPAGQLAAAGISLQAFSAGPAVRIAPPSPLAHLERARERFADAAERTLPAREAALVRAIATGDSSALDAATRTSFARSGLAHILAVSGLHLVVVALGLERLLRWALLRIEAIAVRVDARRAAAAVVLPVAALYSLATGAGVPVLRGAIALAAAAAGALLDRETSGANILALAALALLAGEPAAALDPSLQLSFASVAGLVVWSGPLRHAIPVAVARRGSWRAWVVEPLLGGACATVAASIATAPVLAFHFRQLPVLGVLANVAGVPIGSALTAVATLAAVLAAASPALAAPRIAAAFVSHPHPDHVLGFAAVAAAFDIEQVFSNGDRGDGPAREVLATIRPATLLPGDRWARAGVRFAAVGGARETFAANDASLVLRVTYGETTFLFAGDLEEAGEASAIAQGGLRADVVKVPHHGSRTSSTAPFAAAVRPRLAVVSSGLGNRYGFPHEEALAHWRDVGALVLRTDGGAIRLLSDGRRVRRVPAGAALDPLAIRAERTHACGVRIEDVDLMEIAERLRRHIPEGEPPGGYLRGRSYFRDVLAHELGCSELEAEELVDTLEMNGYLKFEGDPSVRSRG